MMIVGLMHIIVLFLQSLLKYDLCKERGYR